MSKMKSFVFDLFDDNKLTVNNSTRIQDAEFWTTDRDAYLSFGISRQGFVINKANINLYNKSDKSLLIDEPMTIVNNEARFKMSSDVMSHFGQWSAQVIFNDLYTSPAVNFEILRALGSGTPDRIGLIHEWDTLNNEVKVFVSEIEGFTLEQFVETKMGEELANLETNYATRLTGLEQKDNQLTAQLAQKANDADVRKKAVKLELEDMSPTTLSAIEGGEGTSFNLLSEPQDSSVTFQKMDSIAGLNMYPFHKKATLNSNRTAAERIFNAIIDVKLYGADPLSKYRIGYLRKAHLSQGLYYWAVIVYNDMNVDVCRFYETNAELISGYEGLQEIQLSERDNSGVSGKVIIDWSALGTSFNNTTLTYEDTGLDVLTYNSLGGFLINEGSAW